MAATATSFGNGVWGLSAEQVGMVLETLTYDFTDSSKEIKNRTGNTTGVTKYDEKAKISLKGKLPATAQFSGTLASSLALGNALSSYNFFKGGQSTGLTIIDGITIDASQEEYQGISIAATNYPNIT
jgi:hypothetical protein